MTDHVYKHVTVTGTSVTSSDDAIRAAISKASKTVHGIHWFEVLETRGQINGGEVKQWQVSIRIAFTLDD